MSNRKLLTATFLVSLILHVLLAVLTLQLEVMPRWTPSALAAEPTVELWLLPDREQQSATAAEEPSQYTEIPDRLADERPERADYLAMRDSRAADRLPGGQAAAQPGTEREAEFPQVSIAPENLAGADGVSLEQPVFTPQPASPRRQEQPRSSAAEPPDGAETTGPGDLAVPRPQERTQERTDTREAEAGNEDGDFADWLSEQRTPTLLKEGQQQPPGDSGFDFRQLEQGRIGANVNLDGDFSLNTYEWNFAPWMRRFANDLHRAWIAPYAYRLGVIDGVTRVRLVVERDGRPSRMEIVDRQGHDSLHTASVAALQAFAPYAPLPPDFPEDHLVILLGLHYPAWKR